MLSLKLLNDLSESIIETRRKAGNLEINGDILWLFVQVDPTLSNKALRDVVI